MSNANYGTLPHSSRKRARDSDWPSNEASSIRPKDEPSDVAPASRFFEPTVSRAKRILFSSGQFDSKILSADYKCRIANLLGSSWRVDRLLFSKYPDAKKNLFSSTSLLDSRASKPRDFHKKCDGKGATIVVLRVQREYGGSNVFGGFAASSWSSVATYHNDSENFLFVEYQYRLIKFDNIEGPSHTSYQGAGPVFGFHDVPLDGQPIVKACEDAGTPGKTGYFAVDKECTKLSVRNIEQLYSPVSMSEEGKTVRLSECLGLLNFETVGMELNGTTWENIVERTGGIESMEVFSVVRVS